MKRLISLCFFAALLSFICCMCPSVTTAEQSADATIRIQAARIARSSADLTKQFSGRYYNSESGAPASLQLLLKLKDGVVLAMPRDAISIETFVDDTYQNLLVADGSTSYYSGNTQTLLTDDGKGMLFTVLAGKSPAERAERVFVRGSVKVPISRDKPIVVTNRISLIVGQEAVVGPFRTALRSVSAYEQVSGSGSGLGVMLFIEGNPWRILKIRLLGADGKILNDEKQTRPIVTEMGDKPLNFNTYLRTATNDAVTLEYTYLEKSEMACIPFEAQVDIGNTQAGPVGSEDSEKPKEKGSRSWPPAREEKVANDLPKRREAFQPSEQPGSTASTTATPLLTNATVDVFSITVGKPDPSEIKTATWNNSPSTDMFACGFTVARLMLTTPGASILSLPVEGVSITRFEDDKGTKLSRALYLESSSQGSDSKIWPNLRRNSSGDQILFNLPLVSSPSQGATRCSLAGSIEAKVARGEITSRSDRFTLQTGATFEAGPFKGRLAQVRRIPPASPGRQSGDELEVILTLQGPLTNIRSVQFQDSAQKTLNANRTSLLGDSGSAVTIRLYAVPVGQVTFILNHFTIIETVRVPFDFNVGIGL